MLKRIVDSAAAPGTEISVNGLSPHRAIAEQYRYLEFLEPPKSDQRGEAGAVGVRNVRLTRRILTVSATCGISETKIVCQQIRYSMRSPKCAACSSIRPRFTRNQFTGELLHRMLSKKWKIKAREKFLKTNAFIPNPLSGVDVTRGQDCRQFYFDGFVRYIAFYELVKVGQLELLVSNVTLDQHVSAVRRPYPVEGRTHRARPRAQSSCNTWSTPHPAAVVANRRTLPTSTVAPKRAGSSKASGTASSTI